jgi:hypothetical protein
LILSFWIVLQTIHDLPLSAEGWASLVPLRCPLSWLFDIQCPTCGLGRSLVAAALGHAQESFRFHPFGLPLFWGSQVLLLCWMVWPRGWARVRHFCQYLFKRRVLMGTLIVLYSLWGFCWRAPL